MAFGRDKKASQDVSEQIADLNKSLSELRRTLDSQEREMDELRTKLKMVTDENAQIKRLISDTTQIKASLQDVEAKVKAISGVVGPEVSEKLDRTIKEINYRTEQLTQLVSSTSLKLSGDAEAHVTEINALKEELEKLRNNVKMVSCTTSA